MLIYECYKKWRKKYTKLNHEIFYTAFFIKKSYTMFRKKLLAELNILHQITKHLHQIYIFFHQIREI